MTQSPYIPQTILDAIYERVCRPIDYLNTKLTPSTPLWDGPVDMCQQIEANAMAVDSVIVEAKKHNSLFNGLSSPRVYHAILCRVYLLAYYKHRDDKVYQTIVFPRLTENMGVYREKHLQTIQAKIDEILQQEELIRQMQTEKRNDQKPDTATPAKETFTRADIETIGARYAAQIEELKAQLAQQEAKLAQQEAKLAQQEAKLAQQEEQLAAKDTEIKRLNYEYAELEKQKQSAALELENLEPKEQLGIDERIVFFTSALRVDLTDDSSNQSGLARFICGLTGNGLKSVRPRINKIAQMYKAGNIDEPVTEAARNVTDYIMKCWKADGDQLLPLSEAAEQMIEDIETIHGIGTTKHDIGTVTTQSSSQLQRSSVGMKVNVVNNP